MALGGIILYLQQNLLDEASVVGDPIIGRDQPFTFEFRVRFPAPSNTVMPPTQLSGALVTLSTGSTASSIVSLWYERLALGSMTGNIFLTSSAGRLELSSGPFFDDTFYNLCVVKERVTGSVTLYATQHELGELTYTTSSYAASGTAGYPHDSNYGSIELGSSVHNPSFGEFWGHEFRLWNSPIVSDEVLAHSAHYESYGRETSYENEHLKIHWRLADASNANGIGDVFVMDSSPYRMTGTGSNFVAGENPFTKFLMDYAYIPGIDYGWNQEKVRTFSGSIVDPLEAYEDERFVALEFNMYDALNEDISHVMSSYDELNSFIGLPVNRYREDYEGLRQMRETYFKRLQGQLNFRVFTDMLDFFDSSFIEVVRRLLPARALFKGDELVVESHMLERPKYQYQLRPVIEGRLEIGGTISVVDYGDDE